MEHLFDEIPGELEEYKKDPKKWLRIWRNRYEVPVFDILKKRYGYELEHFWDTHQPPQISNKAFVIVERRCHPNLEFVLHNMFYFGRDWSIYLFCSEQNYEFCKGICGKNRNTVNIIPIFDKVVSAEEGVREYNQLLQEYSFWQRVQAEHICVMETDCYLRKPIPEELLEYDYVGTPWGWDLSSPGGSGLTLRRRSAMLKICLASKKTEMQDSFVAQGIVEQGLTWLPAKPYGVATFVESYFTDDPVGVHQWWTFVFNRFLYGKSLNILWDYLILEV
jgi:hypothetical protein